MSTWENICRVCGSTAQYDVFSKIPVYLHESSNEFINWQKTIDVLLEETTGLTISRDDGLPTSICALCISYLKHAVTFRDQVIRNTLSLEVIKQIQTEKSSKINPHKSKEDKDSLLITEQELNVSEHRKLNSNILTSTVQNGMQHKVSKELFQVDITLPTQDYIMQQMRYLNLLFDKDVNAGLADFVRQGSTDAENLASNQQQYVDTEEYEETTSNDEEENFVASGVSKKLFSYSEKNFEEDDIMNLKELRDAINVTVPETFKERKCRACFRRFMFEESYGKHMEKCFEFKFLTFIEEINLLLDIRRKKAVSPHEFIRRMIFSLRKICDFLKDNSEEISMPPETTDNDKNAEENNPQTNETISQRVIDLTESVLFNSSVEESTLKDEEHTALLDFLKPKPIKSDLLLTCDEQQLFTNRSQSPRNTATPITIHNNILYEIERSLSRCTNPIKTPIEIINDNDDSTDFTRLMRPIPVHAATPLQQSPRAPSLQLDKSPTQNTEEERLTFLQKLERALYQTPPQIPGQHSALETPSSISVRKDLMPNIIKDAVPASPSTFSACCNPCQIYFDTINAFEVHNAMYHNYNGNTTTGTACKQPQQKLRRTSDKERKRIIAMFESDDF